VIFSERSPLHLYGHSYVSFLRALMTFESTAIGTARTALSELEALCRRAATAGAAVQGGWLTRRVPADASVAADALLGETLLLGGILCMLGMLFSMF
jgi:hypothetical protein